MAVASTTRVAEALRVMASASSSVSMATRAAPSTSVCPPLGWCWIALFSAGGAGRQGRALIGVGVNVGWCACKLGLQSSALWPLFASQHSTAPTQPA
jgi:hypothetical protein